MAKPDAGDADARERTAEVPIATTVSSVLAVHVTSGGRKREQTARTVQANRITGSADQFEKKIVGGKYFEVVYLRGLRRNSFEEKE